MAEPREADRVQTPEMVDRYIVLYRYQPQPGQPWFTAGVVGHSAQEVLESVSTIEVGEKTVYHLKVPF